MAIRGVLAVLLLCGIALAPTAMPWSAPLAAQDSDDDDDDDDGEDDGEDDDDEVEDPDDQDQGEMDEPDNDPMNGEDAAGDDPDMDDAGDDDAGDDDGGDDDGGDDAGGDDAGGDDDGPAGGGDDDANPAGGGGSDDDDGPGDGDDDGSPAGAGGGGGDDDDGPGGGDDDNRANPGGSDNDNDDIQANNDDADDRGRSDGDDGNEDINDDREDRDDAFEAVDLEPVSWEIIVGDTASDRSELDQRDAIDTDNDGFRYRRSEFIALDLSDADLAELKAGGFEVIASEKLMAVGGRLLLLRGPAQLSDEAALDSLEDITDPDSVGYNHLFDSSAVQTSRNRAATLPQRQACGCDIGLIDTGVAASLAYFNHVKLIQRAFNGKAAQPRMHGTAVAHLIGGTKSNPARPTKILVAYIFSGPRETAGSSFALVKALDWLAAQGVPVINVSLSGPRNPAVAESIARVNRRGHVVVAAAGNDGPAAPPVFPGAYDGVLGVTAVDAQNRVYRYANRGAHVDFAARGVSVPAIDAAGQLRDATGTSFAAPVIAARLAGRLRKPDAAEAQNAIRALEAEARDLGPRGRDPIYGAGLIGGES